ncbi:MAG: hypothetical protein ABI068_05675 [Ktedonobacterales bacterium]
MNAATSTNGAGRTVLQQRPAPKLVIIRSPYRALVASNVRYVRPQQRIRTDATR